MAESCAPVLEMLLLDLLALAVLWASDMRDLLVLYASIGCTLPRLVPPPVLAL